MKKKKHTSAAPSTTLGTAAQLINHGWWSVLVYLTLGIVLEALHGFKIGWYLDVSNETRRLMLTLAHAHGTLIGLINIAAGLTGKMVAGFSIRRDAAGALRLAGVMLPLGFFLGGVIIHDGDPGLGVLLVPVGGVVLLYGVVRMALDLRQALHKSLE